MSAQAERVLLPLAVALAAVLGGVAVASVTWRIWALVIVFAIGAAILVAIRVATKPDHPVVVPQDPDGPGFRVARALYYAGAATIGLLIVRPALDFTVSDWLFLAALAVAVAVVLQHGARLPFLVPRSIVVGVLLFSAGGLISSFGAVMPNESVSIVVRMLYLTIVWFWLGTVVLRTREHVQIALAAWVLSAAVSSAGAVVQFFAGDVISGSVVHYGRMSGLTSNLNVLGGLAATAVVPALMLALDGHRRSVRVLGVASTALVLAGVFLSGSVGGMMATASGIAVWLVIRGVGMRVILVGCALAVAGTFLLVTAETDSDVSSPAQRFLRVTDESQADRGTGGTLYTRLEGWQDAWSRIERQPFVGVGLDEESSLAVTLKPVHSMVVGPWFTAGILGLAGVIVLVVASIKIGLGALRRSEPRWRSSTAAAFAALCVFVQFSLGEPILYVRYGWFPTALLIVIAVQQRVALAAARAPVPAPTVAGARATPLRPVASLPPITG